MELLLSMSLDSQNTIGRCTKLLLKYVFIGMCKTIDRLRYKKRVIRNKSRELIVSVHVLVILFNLL